MTISRVESLYLLLHWITPCHDILKSEQMYSNVVAGYVFKGYELERTWLILVFVTRGFGLISWMCVEK